MAVLPLPFSMHSVSLFIPFHGDVCIKIFSRIMWMTNFRIYFIKFEHIWLWKLHFNSISWSLNIKYSYKNCQTWLYISISNVMKILMLFPSSQGKDEQVRLYSPNKGNGPKLWLTPNSVGKPDDRIMINQDSPQWLSHSILARKM